MRVCARFLTSVLRFFKKVSDFHPLYMEAQIFSDGFAFDNQQTGKPRRAPDCKSARLKRERRASCRDKNIGKNRRAPTLPTFNSQNTATKRAKNKREKKRQRNKQGAKRKTKQGSKLSKKTNRENERKTKRTTGFSGLLGDILFRLMF